MEEILGLEMRQPISLTQFLANYKQLLESDHNLRQATDLQQAMHLCNEPQRFKMAREHCALTQLLQDDDVRVTDFHPGLTEFNRINTTKVPPEALKLKTFENLLHTKETTTRNPFKRSRDIYKMVPLPPKDEHDAQCDFYNDLLVTIRVYRPARATHIGQSLEKPVFAEEFECLGTNLLTELRDKISCVCNKKRFFDVSEQPSAELPEKNTDPGYFFITDTFYNDKRNKSNADYSEVIRNWAKQAPGLKSLQFKVASMELTRFMDLTVSLGFPQLYQHHGNCEHVFTFAQVEILRPGVACTTRSQYPRLCSFGLFNTRSCNMCGTRSYNFIVEHSDRQLHDPAYLCAKCLYSFHYSDGKKIGQFKAYRVNDCIEHVEEEMTASQLASKTDAVESVTAEQSNDMLTHNSKNLVPIKEMEEIVKQEMEMSNAD